MLYTLLAAIIYTFNVSTYFDLRREEKICQIIWVNWHGTDDYANKYFEEGINYSVGASYHCVIPVGLEEVAVQLMFLSRTGSRETQVWSIGLEHSL